MMGFIKDKAIDLSLLPLSQYSIPPSTIKSNPSVSRIEEASEPVTQGFSPELSALKG
jgi:hypothetical protein